MRIELISWVAIVLIVCFLFVPFYLSSKDEEVEDQIQENNAQLILKRLAASVQLYMVDKKHYPYDVKQNSPVKGLVPEYVFEWPYSYKNKYHSSFDYDAWVMPGGGYWIGITWYGKNNKRDFHKWEYIKESSGMKVRKIGDDYFIEIDRNAKVGP